MKKDEKFDVNKELSGYIDDMAPPASDAGDDSGGRKYGFVGAVRYVGKDFGHDLLNGDIYECIAIERGMLRIIDNMCLLEGDRIGYLYSAQNPGPLFGGDGETGRWEIYLDPERRLKELIENPQSAVLY